MSGTLTVHRLGCVEYVDGLALVRLFARAQREGHGGDVLLLLEHPPVLALGRGAPRERLGATQAQLAEAGVTVVEAERERALAFHDPGQVVGHLLLARQPGAREVERALVEALAHLGLTAGVLPDRDGVWLGAGPEARRVATVERGGAGQRFALDVSTRHERLGAWDLETAGARTSLARELGREVPIEEVEALVAGALARGLGRTRVDGGFALRTVSVAVVRGEGTDARVLVLRRRPERGGFWQLVTGRLEPGESPTVTAQRELREETGLTTPVRPLGYVHAFALGEAVPPVLTQETAFAVRLPAGAQVQTGPEHDAHAWLSVPDTLARLPFAGLQEAVRRALRLG